MGIIFNNNIYAIDDNNSNTKNEDSNILPIYTFPINNYPQDLNYWLSDTVSTTNILLDKPLQQKKFNQLKSHYFGMKQTDQSPWSESFVKKVLLGIQDKNIYTIETQMSEAINNQLMEKKNIGYGINYLPYAKSWSDSILDNMNLPQFNQLSYSMQNRAIVTSDVTAFVTPTKSPWYKKYSIAGEGFPFNHNRISNIYTGTPVYIIGVSKDSQWYLVLTPHFIGWVNSLHIAKANNIFIQSWRHYLSHGMIAITGVSVGIFNHAHDLVSIAHAGTILPLAKKNKDTYDVVLPIKSFFGVAVIQKGTISNNDSVIMPLSPTYDNFKIMIGKVMGHLYGWGGYMGYNDCSSELQGIFTAFGMFMPRNSLQQTQMGELIDLTKYTPKERMDYIIKNGHPMMTLVYIPGHIMLYVGNKKMTDGTVAPVVYQNLWGFQKRNENARYVVGGSILLPMLLSYDSASSYISHLEKPIFKISQLDVDGADYDLFANIFEGK